MMSIGKLPILGMKVVCFIALRAFRAKTIAQLSEWDVYRPAGPTSPWPQFAPYSMSCVIFPVNATMMTESGKKLSCI